MRSYPVYGEAVHNEDWVYNVLYSYKVYSTRVWETGLPGGFIPAHPGPLGTKAVRNEDKMYNVQLYSVTVHVYGKQFYLEDLFQPIQVPWNKSCP